jgi:DNA helicase-2/ATP-dependent DNA helicase PcrA
VPKFSAQDVYSILGPHTLTPEQVAAVESASITEPTLVIAGAGSGKTELMSVRILYLVANEFAKPQEILGLTFTKKAASELSARVLKALYLLRESEMWPKSLEADFLPPKIATYNSFGNEVFRQFAVEVGLEPDSQVLGESASVGLARELLRKLSLDEHPELADWDRTAGYLTEKLLSMVQEITDNRVSAEAVRDYLMRFESHVSLLPKSEGGSMERFAYTQTFLTEAATNALLAALALKFIELKRERNLVDYADQVSLALDAAESASVDLGYRFVMLDEYQDTSAIQVQFLATLFRGKPVMAVGDPNQSIYGFRGASSANLTGFFEDFGSGETLTLSTCWRSTAQIVDVANLIARPLGAEGIKKIELVANNSGSAVRAHYLQDIESEAELVANYFAAELGDQTGALLMRTKSQMGLFVAALEARGVTTEVSGLSGLIEIPEVLDLISALRVLASSQASVEVIRLLTGPKWRIGLRDIAKLGELAKRLTRLRPEADSSSEVTLVEALDSLRFDGSGQNSEISEPGLARLRNAATVLNNLRSTPSLTITELAWMVVRELDIDIELYARSRAANPLRHIEQFISRLSEYESVSSRPSLSGLMQWLDYALEHDSFELPRVGSKRGVVQVMSVHASKGLEWDLVWVAQLTQGAFPIEGKDSKGWLAAGKIPFDLRADGRSLPVFDFASATTQKQLNELFSEFKEANRQRASQEERRLAYVAFTRAAKQLVLSGSYYKANAQSPRAASVFLAELQDAGLIDLSLPEALEQNPLDATEQLISWPGIVPDNTLDEQANAVLNAPATKEITSHELALLFEERDRMRTRQIPDLPQRLSVSRVLKLLDDPKSFFEELARPMPPQYSDAAAIGTAFHSYIEAALGEQEDLEEGTSFTELVQNFEKSKFHGLKPAFIEQPIEFVLDGLVVVCKLDAVFQDGDSFEIVDWKSGSVPDDEKLESRKVQLALYRIALSRWLNVPIERIRASFFYAADAVEVSPTGLPNEADLISRIREARTARPN